jgi:hypothetical protein
MRRILLAVIVALLLAPASAWSGEKVDEELAKLRTEVAALRAAIEKLAGKTPDPAELLARLQEIARKVAAGEKLAEGGPELALLRDFLLSGYRMGGYELGARAMGIVRNLPADQRGALLASVLTDLSVTATTRQTALRDLAGCDEKTFRAAVLKALELERLLPPAQIWGGGGGGWGDIRAELATAGIKLKEKAAVDFTLDYLQGIGRTYESNLRNKEKDPRVYYAATLYGQDAELVRKLAAWSGDAELGKYAPQPPEDARWGRGMGGMGYTFKTAAEAAAFLAELDKVRDWWKGGREKFVFPAEEVKPPEAPKAVDPANPPPDPAKDPKKPEVF